tara:strand:- start:1077 stop:1262 length:186 start_codon:yes stop_codon:yes gene_type:complete
MDLETKLMKIDCLLELDGFLRRREIFNILDDAVFPEWTAEERNMILNRKYELERKNADRRK